MVADYSRIQARVEPHEWDPQVEGSDVANRLAVCGLEFVLSRLAPLGHSRDVCLCHSGLVENRELVSTVINRGSEVFGQGSPLFRSLCDPYNPNGTVVGLGELDSGVVFCLMNAKLPRCGKPDQDR
jgi:hypothetical protein